MPSACGIEYSPERFSPGCATGSMITASFSLLGHEGLVLLARLHLHKSARRADGRFLMIAIAHGLLKRKWPQHPNQTVIRLLNW